MNVLIYHNVKKKILEYIMLNTINYNIKYILLNIFQN